jgi:hypothetical protein
MSRWQVKIYYRTDLLTREEDRILDEVRDLHDIIERGPHWDTIEKIEIFRINHVTSKTLTVEQAEQM